MLAMGTVIQPATSQIEPAQGGGKQCKAPPVYKQGLLDRQGRPYPTMVQAVRDANREVLARLYAPMKPE